jgi:hypothetical protein
MSIRSNEFPNALFASEDSARAGFRLQQETLRNDPTAFKPSFVNLLGVLRATRPSGKTGYCYRAQYAGFAESVYGPGETGDSRESLEKRGWSFEPIGDQARAG